MLAISTFKILGYTEKFQSVGNFGIKHSTHITNIDAEWIYKQ
jgi:hypothetical protein